MWSDASTTSRFVSAMVTGLWSIVVFFRHVWTDAVDAWYGGREAFTDLISILGGWGGSPAHVISPTSLDHIKRYGSPIRPVSVATFEERRHFTRRIAADAGHVAPLNVMPPTNIPRWPTQRTLRRFPPTHVLALDLDGTLVASTTLWGRVSGMSPRGHPPLGPPTFCEAVPTYKGAELYYVWVRPHLKYFLDAVSRLYVVVLFTAAVPSYADAIVRHVDPWKRYVKKCFYRRDCRVRPSANTSVGDRAKECPESPQVEYVKDLSVTGAPAERVILVDNDPRCCATNPRNSILVTSYVPTRADDDELLKLLPLLEALHYVPDVRQVLQVRTS